MRMPPKAFPADTRGATAIEYSLIASGIAGAIIAVVAALGSSVQHMWSAVAAAFN